MSLLVRLSVGFLGLTAIIIVVSTVFAAQTAKGLTELWVTLVWHVVAVSVPVSLFIAFWISRVITKPLSDMTQSVKAMASGSLNVSFYPGSFQESRELADGLNFLAGAMRDNIAELLEGRQRLEAVLQHMVDPVLLVASGGQLILANPAAEKLFEFKAEEFLGKHVVEVTRSYELANYVNSVAKSGQSKFTELNILETGGILEIHIVPIKTFDLRGENISSVLVVGHDVTETKKLERMRSEFVANVSHELKTPLTAIKGFAETLMEGAINDKQTAQRFVRVIHEETERLSRLIEDLLDLSEIEARQNRLELSEVDVGQIIDEALERFHPAAERQEIQIQGLVNSRPLIAIGDKDRLLQVLANLLDNSLKYTPRGGKVVVKGSVKDNRVLVEVTDTGVGIPKSELNRIFERFYRVDKTRSRHSGGTGLGLAIVKHIIESHGGQVGVSSEEGKGTTFWFTLKRPPGS